MIEMGEWIGPSKPCLVSFYCAKRTMLRDNAIIDCFGLRKNLSVWVLVFLLIYSRKSAYKCAVYLLVNIVLVYMHTLALNAIL